jgi:hypothetical protein
MDTLSPAAKATLDALAELGQANVHEVRDKSGKARSTTDKALKELADAGLIVALDTGADPADDTPTRWQLATSDTDTAAGIADPTTDTTRPDVRDGLPEQDPAAATGPSQAPALPARPADRKVLIVAGVLGDYPDGTTVDTIAEACGLGVTAVMRLLTAMAQADAARRIPADPETGAPERWQPGEGKASQVDPNPAPERCPTCGQVVRTQRTANAGTTTRESAPLNDDGNEPLARNVLRGWVHQFINDHPAHVLTPQDIATELSARHHRVISSGAVRNNCTTLAAAGQIQLVTETPLAFATNPVAPGEPTEP